MPTIITQTSNVLHITGDFTIRHLVSFSIIPVLSGGLPSSEEGRSAFKIAEGTVATVQAVLTAPGFLGSEEIHTEVLASILMDNIVEPTISEVESSRVYSRMKDENKKKVTTRLRKLLETLSKKEALESNAALLEGDQITIPQVDEEISTLTFKINHLLGICSTKPLVELKDLDLAIEEFVQLQPDTTTLDRPALATRLVEEIRANYDILG